MKLKRHRIFKRPSTRFFVSLGLSSLTASVLLLAMYLGLVPDRISAIRMGRAALAEAVAVSSSALISQADTARTQAMLEFLVQRNPDLLSIAIRKADGSIFASHGDHTQWRELTGSYSIDAQVVVPIMAGPKTWGQVELRFTALTATGWRAYVTEPRVELIGFTVLVGFFAFYFYLGRTLRQLDPSKAIPNRVRNALDTLAEGLLIIDAQGYLVLANQAFANVVAQSPDKLIGREVASFAWVTSEGEALSPKDFPWTAALRTGTQQRNERVSLVDAEGRLRAFLVNASPVIDKAKGVLISLDDVTELQEKEIELRTARDDAEAANRAKSDFLANMSHEIRTPMNAILGFTDLLRRGYHKTEAEMARHLNTIHSSGKHLLDLINDILDLAKVESGHLEFEHEPCAPHAIISEVVEILAVRAEDKGIWLRFECSGLVPATVMTDAGRIRQIVTNLVGNAIKFTDRGGVKVVLRLQRERNAQTLSIEVIDSGIGIPPDRVEAVFEPFVQAEGSTTRRYGGTGLGLTISRKFARGLGGDIVARSELGKGSVFALTIDPGSLDGVRMLTPAEAMTQAAERQATSATTWEFPAAAVLVVDDGEANRDLVRLVLEEAGLTVDLAENGKIGAEKALARNYGVILMDMQMPVMDGFTASRLLRSRGLKTPIYALTANAMKGFEREVMEAGCSGYLTKPVDIDLLLETLAKLLGGRRAGAPLKKVKPAPLTSDMSKSVGVVASGEPIVSRLATHPRLRSIVRKFAVQMPEKMREIEQAYEARDFDALSALAHWLKGSGGTTGYDDFTAPARRLEELAKARDEANVAAVIDELRDMVTRLSIPTDEAVAAS